MPDTKITALTALTAADPANDMMPIVDVSDTSMAASGTTKRISINNILACSPSATLASATITGNLTVDTNTLFVDSANNRVGIGTASPTELVHALAPAGGGNMLLEGTAGNFPQFISKVGAKVWSSGYRSGTTAFELWEDSSQRYTIGNGGTPHTWYIGASTAMTLNSTGLGVGVGPSYQIHARKDQATYTTIAVDNANVLTSGAGSQFLLLDATVPGGWFRRQRDGTGNTDIGYRNALRFRGDIGGTERTDMTLDPSGNLLVGTTSAGGSSSNATALVFGGARTASGSVSAATAVATTIFSITAALTGRYEVVALVGFSGAPAQYTAIATIIWDGNGSRVVANNGTNLTITISGSNVQITQTSGSTQTVSWSFLRIAL